MAREVLRGVEGRIAYNLIAVKGNGFSLIFSFCLYYLQAGFLFYFAPETMLRYLLNDDDGQGLE